MILTEYTYRQLLKYEGEWYLRGIFSVQFAKPTSSRRDVRDVCVFVIAGVITAE